MVVWNGPDQLRGVHAHVTTTNVVQTTRRGLSQVIGIPTRQRRPFMSNCYDPDLRMVLFCGQKQTTFMGLSSGLARQPSRLWAEQIEACDDDDTVGDLDESTEIVEQSQYIEIGIVGPPHGVKGEFKVQSLTDWPEDRLGQKGTRYLRAPESTFHMARLKNSSSASIEKVTLMRGRASVYKGREVWIVKLKGINTPEEAQAIHGHTLLVHESVRDELHNDDEFYVQQLIGLRVELMDNQSMVGTVVDIMDGTGTHDVLCIENTNADATILLPFARELVPVVDITQGVIQITPPEGLLEMYQKKPQKEDRKKRPRQRKQM